MNIEGKPHVPSRPGAVLLVALGMGAVGEYLFQPGLLGINVAIWTALLCAAVFLAASISGLTLRGEGRWLIAAALLFAGFVAWRASPVLQAVNTGAVIAILAVASFRLREGRVRLGGVTEYFLAGIVSLGLTVIGMLELVFRQVQWRAAASSSGLLRGLPLLRGAVIAAPLLVLFAVLLSSADEVFSNALTGWLEIDPAALAAHAFRALFWAWLPAGFFHAALLREPEPAFEQSAPAALRLGPVEVTTVLGLLDLLFLAFVAVQVRYLFGVSDHVEVTEGLTYAEYARRGFFELLTVAALVLPVVLVIHWLLRDFSPVVRVAFRVLAATMVLLIFAVIASALKRMDAYVDEFGLTQLRFYSTAAMLWLVIVFAWLAATVLREQRQRFASGALASGLFVLAGLNLLNPDGFIVETNLDRAGDREFDGTYAMRLSPDATPTLVAALPKLPPSQRCQLAHALLAKPPASGGWQAWNLGRRGANQELSGVDLVEACSRP